MLFGDMTATDARRELPLSARLLDALSGVFIVTLLCVLIFGPVRIDAVVANLSVSSLARLLALLAASVAVRHLAWPRPPFHLRFLAAARALAGSVALRRALPPFLATRGAVLFTGVLAVLTIGLFENHARCVEALSGNLDPMTSSRSSKVIGISALPDLRK